MRPVMVETTAEKSKKVILDAYYNSSHYLTLIGQDPRGASWEISVSASVARGVDGLIHVYIYIYITNYHHANNL